MNNRDIYFTAFSGTPVAWALLRDDGSSARFLHRFLAVGAWRDRGARETLRIALGCLAWPFVMPALVLDAMRDPSRSSLRILERLTGFDLQGATGQQTHS